MMHCARFRKTSGIGFLAAALALLGPAAPLAAGEHVRVVLDVSGSMQQNDPGRLAILSTLLLHDLAAPNPTLDDSFEILPFDRNWKWKTPGDAPPKSTRPRLRTQYGERTHLVAALDQLRYDAAKTYFYPGLWAAAAELRQTPGGAYDVRTLVLVTDGVPEPPTREREAELIRRDLVPRLEEHGIRLYILAFSSEALSNREFLEAMVRGGDGRRLGEVFLDPDGRRLLAHMLELFARSFGYTGDTARELPGVDTLDLEGGSNPERVAVVVHSPGPQPPTLALTPPPGGAWNVPDGVVRGRQTGASYSLAWSLSPDSGAYGFATDARRGAVAVLRPTRLELEILPAPPHRRHDVAMAQRPFPLRVRVRSPIGAVGDPGPVNLSLRPLGERVRDPATGQEDHRWRGDRIAPPAGPGTATPEGRLYDAVVEFEDNRQAPGELYAGYLEVEARRGEAVVGSLLGHDAHRVEVHPLLALVPLPLAAYVSEHALGPREESCTRFALTVEAGELPHPKRPEYALRAVLDPADKAVLERELRDAFFTLDGVPLGIEQLAGPEPGAWYKGRTLKREALVGEHEICVRLGKPVQGDPAQPLEVPLRISLLESPYDDFQVVAPFTLKVLIAPPGVLDRWRALLVLGCAALALAALLWYLRDRPALPADLRYSLTRADAPPAAQELAPGSLLGRLLGRVVERPLAAAGEETTLGWLRPSTEELYEVRPTTGVRITGDDGRRLADRVWTNLEVHRPYRLETGRGSYLLRMEYAA